VFFGQSDEVEQVAVIPFPLYFPHDILYPGRSAVVDAVGFFVDEGLYEFLIEVGFDHFDLRLYLVASVVEFEVEAAYISQQCYPGCVSCSDGRDL
jgi:hypothetical protein